MHQSPLGDREHLSKYTLFGGEKVFGLEKGEGGEERAGVFEMVNRVQESPLEMSFC